MEGNSTLSGTPTSTPSTTVADWNKNYTSMIVKSLSATAQVPNNFRNSVFFEIAATLTEMANLDPTSDFYVGHDIKLRAEELVAKIRDLQNIDFPKILPEGEESISFTWNYGKIIKLLTIYNDEIESTILNTSTGFRCTHQVSDGPNIDLVKIAEALETRPKSETI